MSVQASGRVYRSRINYAINITQDAVGGTIREMKEELPAIVRPLTIVHYIAWPFLLVPGFIDSYRCLRPTEKGYEEVYRT